MRTEFRSQESDIITPEMFQAGYDAFHTGKHYGSEKSRFAATYEAMKAADPNNCDLSVSEAEFSRDIVVIAELLGALRPLAEEADATPSHFDDNNMTPILVGYLRAARRTFAKFGGGQATQKE